MNENISPEEKLLRLIRNSPKPQREEKAVFRTPFPRLSQKPVDFSFARKIIWVCFILSCIYLIFSFTVPYKQAQIAQAPEPAHPKPASEGPAIKPYDVYAQAINKRRIFAGAQESARQAGEAIVNQDLTKDFVLTGIISGDNPQAVIENKKAQKIYYLNKGQFIDGFQVADIQEGKVVLQHDDQKFELYL